MPTVIYAEIPEANAWLTGLGVVLGVGQFGLAGVVLGPLLASVPLICCSDWDVSAIFFDSFGMASNVGKCLEPKVPTCPNTHNVKLCFSWLFIVFLFADHRISQN